MYRTDVLHLMLFGFHVQAVQKTLQHVFFFFLPRKTHIYNAFLWVSEENSLSSVYILVEKGTLLDFSICCLNLLLTFNCACFL